ncbi:hypothetical protein KFE80_10080 [bacterium SCSIO 12696]|nr:hypothetical protein KFE80_10080 [bacterium SCSIO 12696]
MSYQQINLYRKQNRSAGSGLAFNLPTVAIAATVLAAVLVFIGVNQKLANNKLRQQLTSNDNQLQQIQAQNQQLQQQLVATSGIDLEQQLAQKQDELVRLQQIRGLMQQQRSARRFSFAEQLSGLADHHQTGISLQQIHLLNGGGYLTMNGETQPAEAVLQYVQKLQQDERFDSARFGSLQLQRDQERHGLVQFQLGDMPEPEGVRP